MIQAVAWDFGNVLAAFSHRQACEQLAALTGGRHSADAVQEWIFASGRHARIEEGTLAAGEFLADLIAMFEIAAPAEEVARAYSDIFVFHRSVSDLVRRLPPGMPCLLASNTDPLHWAFFSSRMADVFRSFRHFVLSFEVGARKPKADFFTALIDRAGCRAGELLFIDDLAANVEGARRLGIDAVVFESATVVERELDHRGIVLAEASGY
jgi:putative hydrolase of the HAD superfamily